MAISDSIRAECTPSAIPRERVRELLRAHLVLMGKLEASLHGSRKALLELDLAGIEGGTGDQIAMMREFGLLLQQTTAAVVSERSAELSVSGVPADLPGMDAEVRESQHRIANALRLQAALLARTQSKLRILANMLAGPTVSYGPLQEGGVAGWNWQLAERSESCRA